jgi:hypothetical protein
MHALRGSGAGVLLWLAASATAASHAPVPIDRAALVTRHNVRLTKADALTPLTVGNGELAFTVDITGLQTFPEYHEAGMPLGTLSQWAWHRFLNPADYRDEDVASPYDAHGRMVPYLDGAGALKNALDPARAKAANEWLRANPHRLDLARIGLVLLRPDGTRAGIADLAETEQTLDLWRGAIGSRFLLDRQPVHVVTLVHPTRDLIAVRIESPLIASGALTVSLAFSYPAGDWRRVDDWERPERHRTTWRRGDHRCDFERDLDGTRYTAQLAWSGDATLDQLAPHSFALAARGREALEFVVAFPQPPLASRLPSFAETRRATETQWRRFWSSGGAIGLGASSDPRAHELERRIVLSQYLTAIQCAGSMPPQETGLVTNSWCGKFHLEMHWWHAAHFALWGRPALLERSPGMRVSSLPLARTHAARGTAGRAGQR